MDDRQYYQNERVEVLKLIKKVPNRSLELGCGEGAFSANLKKKYGCYTMGVELFELAYEEACKKMDNVVNANIETPNFDFKQFGEVDLVIANDVLEHLINPWKVINDIYELLPNQGYFIASIPNIRYYKVIRKLVFCGTWDYEDSGILDRTHLRFFTRKSIEEAFSKFEEVQIVRLNKISLNKRIRSWICPDLYTFQFGVIAKKIK